MLLRTANGIVEYSGARQRPLEPAKKTALVEQAVKVARDPRLLGEIADMAERNRVDVLAKAIQNGASNARPSGAPGQVLNRPLTASQIAARAAGSLGPSEWTVTPPDIEAALRAQGLDMVQPFSPGTPLTPYYGYNRRPRSYDYQIARNTTTETRPDRIPFQTLKQLYDSYDVAQICTRHAINDLRSMRVRFEAMDGYEENPVKEIEEAKRFWRRPDGVRSFRNWMAQHAMDVWRYDAGTLYRHRNRGGKVIGLLVIDATTIAPLLDYYGFRPYGQAPAFQQFIQGVPWDWLSADDLVYEPMWPTPESPYGTPPLETVLVNANTDIRLQLYFLQFFTTGQVPEAFAIAPEGMTDPDAIAELQEDYNNWTYGDQSERWGLRWLPAGTEIESYKPDHFDPEIAEYVMRRTVAAYNQVPHDLGFTDDVNKASGDTQVDTQFRINSLPNVSYYEDICDAITQEDLGLPVQMRFDTGREKEDRLMEARAHQIYVQIGAESPDEVREKVLGYAINPEEKVPRLFDSVRLGPVPISYLLSISGDVDPRTGVPRPGSVEQREFIIPGATVPDPVAGSSGGTDDTAVPSTAPKASGGQAANSSDGKNGSGSGSQPTPQRQAKPPSGHASKEEAEDLQRWRRAARRRVDAGKTPKPFLDSAISDGTFRAVWPALCKATTREQVDEAFAKSASAGHHSPRSGMVSLDVPPGLIPVMEGGVPDQHITVVFLGSDVDDDLFNEVCQVAAAVATATPGPVEGTVGGVGSFPPSESSDWMKPVWAEPDVPAAHELRKSFERFNGSQHKDYHPHMTLAYMAPDDPLPDPVPPTPVSFSHLSVHRGDDVRRFPFGGALKAGDADPKAM